MAVKNAYTTAMAEALRKKAQSLKLNPLDEDTGATGAVTQPAAAATPATTSAAKPATLATSGATAAQTYANRSNALAAQQRMEQARAMSNATPAQAQNMQQEQIRQENLARMSPQAQADIALTQRATTTPTQQEIKKNAYQTAIDQIKPTDTYLWRNMGDNNMTTMSAEDRSKWNTAMAGYANGNYDALNNEFLKAGNYSSYVDENGNVNGMLRAVDGIGGYVPVSNGKLLNYREGDNLSNTAFYGPNGEVYTVGAGGVLKQTGTWSDDYDPFPKNGYYKNDVNDYGDRIFIGKDGRQYTYNTVPDEKLAEWGYVRRNGGLWYEPETVAANSPDGTWMQNNPLYKGGNNGAADLPSTQPSSGSQYSGYERQTVTPSPAPQNNQPVQNTQPVYSGGNTNNPNIYQAYMDQWDYPEAPEWEGTEYQAKRDAALEAAGEKWQGSEYQPLRDAALKRAEQMQWNYDPNTDPVWQAYQKQYRREGDRATQEALAQASMRTGGLANSYAVTAASQAGDYYASQLSDKLPELYQDAYNRYLQEFQRQLGISDQYQGFDDREYSRWADQQGRNFDVADRYNQYGEQDYDKYRDRLSQYNTDRSFDYGRYRDAVGDYRYDDETAYNRNYQAQRDAINDQRYDQQWAQQLREYADAQGWKQAEWNQYLREYGDQLSEKERQWAYQMARDAVSDARYADETAYNRGKYEDETAYQRALYDQEYADERDQNAWERDYKQTAYNDEMQRTALNYLNTNGIVTGRYAEILGVPDGTTYEQYYSRYLGNGGSTIPFDETEIDNGKTQRTTTPPSTPPSTPPDDVQNEPVYQELRSKYGEDTAMEVWNLTQQPWFSELKRVAYSNKNDALDYLYYLVETGKVSNNEKVVQILADMLGLTEESVSYAPEYGTQTGGKKEPFAMIDLKP